MIKEIPKILTSAQNPLVKHWVKLRENKAYRKTQNLTIISGIKIVEEFNKRKSLNSLIVNQEYSLPKSIKCSSIFFVTKEILKKVTGLASPEPVAAEVELPYFQSLNGKNKIIVCDGVSDPGNLGTLIRTALALGWDGVFLLPNCVDPFNEKALRASKGASFFLPLSEGNWQDLKKLIHDNKLNVFVADTHAEPFHTITYPKKIILILANEAHGPSIEGKELGKRISIPMEGDMESLNVSVAGGILMYHLL